MGTASRSGFIATASIHARTGLVTLHGPSGFDFFQEPVHEGTAAAFFRAVTGGLAGRHVRGDAWRVLRGAGSVVRGRVVGGHLGTVRSLVGTGYLPDPDGAVLILEEAFVGWAEVDAALTHLRLAGILDRIAALLVGVPVDVTPGDGGWDDLVLRCVGGDFPVVTGVEFGHTPRKIPLPIGGEIELDLTGEPPALRYRDSLTRRS